MRELYRRLGTSLTIATLMLTMATTGPALAAPPLAPAPFTEFRSPSLSEPLRVSRPAPPAARAYAIGPSDGVIPEPPRLHPDGTVTGGKLLTPGPAALSTMATEAGPTALPLFCPKPALRASLKLSKTSLPLFQSAKVTATLKDANGQPVGGANILMEWLADIPQMVTTNQSGQATFTLSPWYSGRLRFTAEGSDALPAYAFMLAPGEAALDVTVRDRCGQPLDGDLVINSPSWPTMAHINPIEDGSAYFITTERSVSLEANAVSDLDGLPYLLNKAIKPVPGKVTSVLLTGERVAPTTLNGQIDGTDLGGYLYLRPTGAPGPGAYNALTLPATFVATPGTYASMWLSSVGILFKDIVSIKGGAVTTHFKSADLGGITFGATVNGALVYDPMLTIKHLQFGVMFTNGMPISAGKASIMGLALYEPDNRMTHFQRDTGIPVTIKAGAQVAQSWELAQGAPQIVTEPTFDPDSSHSLRLEQRSASGWWLAVFGGQLPRFTLSDPETGVLAEAEFYRENSFYIPWDAPEALTLAVAWPENPYMSEYQVETTLNRNRYELTPSHEVLKVGSSTKLTVTLTKNGRPMASEPITYITPQGRSSTLRTSKSGTVSLQLKPQAFDTHQFVWNHNDRVWQGHAYAVPEGWGLVEASATDLAGEPLDSWAAFGNGQHGYYYGPNETRKAILPAGEQPIIIAGTESGWTDDVTWESTEYLLTGWVTVSSGQTTQVELSGTGTVPLTVQANVTPDEWLGVAIEPRDVPVRFGTSRSDQTEGLTWQVTPGSYAVGIEVYNYTEGYQKLFPGQFSTGGTIAIDTAAATTELLLTGQAEDGRPATGALFTLGTGAGMTAGYGYGFIDKVFAAPGAYKVESALLGFTQGSTHTRFRFSGERELIVSGEPSIALTFGGPLTGSLTTEAPSYPRGESITFTGGLYEQQGLRLATVYTESRTGARKVYGATLKGRGPATLPALPFDLFQGQATWSTTSRTRPGLYTFTYSHDLRGYFKLPVVQATVQID